MKYIILCVAGLSCVSISNHASAAACANGVYRAGCAGPNGAAVVRKPYVAPPPARYYPPAGRTTCASGPYRAGCAGPNGAVIVR